MRIFLIRHGQSEANKEHIIQGHKDSSLSDIGREQAKTAGEKLLESKILFDAVYSSDLSRASETAKIITEVLRIKEIAFDERLREMNLGDYEGRNSKELTEEENAFLNSCWDDHSIRVPNGETNSEFSHRIKETFEEIVASGDDDSTILVVAHGGSLYHILQSTLNILPKNQAWFINCAVNEIVQTQKGKKWTLVKYNGEEIQ